jgi:cation efflux family protein
MAHYRRAVGAAIILNTAVSGVEAAAGFQAGSLSLLMDSAHNLSDEMALVALWLAFFVSRGPSRALLRSANVFNSLGLITISGALLWQAVERVLYPVPVPGLNPGSCRIGGGPGQLRCRFALEGSGRTQRFDPACLRSQSWRRMGFARSRRGRIAVDTHRIFAV